MMQLLFFLYNLIKPHEYQVVIDQQSQTRCYYKWFPFLSWKKPVEEEPVVEIAEDTIDYEI